MMDVFVDSYKETAYGHQLRSFAQALYFVDSSCSDEM